MKVIQAINYKVYIGESVLKGLNIFLTKSKYSKHFIFCDENTFKHCLPILITNCKKLQSAEVIEVESGENSKSLDICSSIWDTLLEHGADKNTLIINLGGGVISDLGGFIASTYKRGVDFINVPTTVLSMADASVGGKTGINHFNLKNVVGTITQPKAVFINTNFTSSLSQRQILNGMAEVVKMALISDKLFWNKLKNANYFNDFINVILKSVELKNKIVIKDPYENNIRKSLNFGHTIGHAIEAVLLNTKDELLHGEAIIIGMITESYISYKKKFITKLELIDIINTITNYFTIAPLHTKHFGAIFKLVLNDKKNKNGKTLCVLLNKIGATKINQAITELQIKQALDFYNSICNGKNQV